MASPTVLQGNTMVNGVLQANTIVHSAGDTHAASILQQHIRKTHAQVGTAVAETRVFHAVQGSTGILKGFLVGIIGPATVDAAVTVDLKKNGTSVLTAVVTINASKAAYVLTAAAFASTSLVTTDVLTWVVTASAGGGALPTGLFAELDLWEDPTN